MKKHLLSLILVLSLLPAQAMAQNPVPLNQKQPPVQVPQAVPPKPQKSTCQAVQDFKTEVHVNILQPKPVYDYAQKRLDLQLGGGNKLAQWAAKNKTALLWRVDDTKANGAIGAGAWAVSMDIQTDSRQVDTYGAFFCPYIKSANIDILSPVLVLSPAEAPVGSCAYDVISKHFERHIQAASDYLKAAAPQIESGLNTLLEQMTQGSYVPKAGLLHAQREMKETVENAVSAYYYGAIRKQLEANMTAIDTEESKAGLAAQVEACPAGVVTKPGIFQLGR
jgi:hypothetical protein